MTGKGIRSLEAIVLLYIASYVPHVLLTRLVSTTVDPRLARSLGGSETLPSALLVNLVLTYLFIALSGWHRDAHGFRIAGIRLPRPTRYTAVSAIGSALVLSSVPLSYTITDVSIPFMQLLLRGDILLIAPLVDVLFGRRVRWWSWTALALVIVALLLVVRHRGGLHLPPLAILVVVLYTVGYFLRLAAMTYVAKTGHPAATRGYFVEEKLLSLPLSIVAIFVLSLTGWAGAPASFDAGLLAGWSTPIFWQVIGIGMTMTVITLCTTIILLGADENSYCVPLERSASLLAGIVASWLLFWIWGLASPTAMEMAGAALLVAAIVLLTRAPLAERRLRTRPSP